MHLDLAHGIQVDLAGLRRHVVLRLAEGVAHGDHALAGSAEIAQRSADFLQFRQARRFHLVEIQNNQLDARIRLGGGNRVRHIAQHGFRSRAARGFAKRAAHGVAGKLLDQFALR